MQRKKGFPVSVISTAENEESDAQMRKRLLEHLSGESPIKVIIQSPERQTIPEERPAPGSSAKA